MRSYIQVLIFFTVWMLSPVSSFAQADYEGLPNLRIYCLVKDHSGLMWLGTQNGVHVFDGYRVSQGIYLRNYQINALAEDRVSNRLWIGTTKGLFYYDFKTGTIVSYPEHSLYYSNYTDRSVFSYKPYAELDLVDNIVTGNGCVYVNFYKVPYIMKISAGDVTTLIRVPECSFIGDRLKVIFAGGEKIFYILRNEIIELDERSGKSVSMGEWDISPQWSFVRIGQTRVLYVNDHNLIRVYDYKNRHHVTDHPLSGRPAIFLSGNKDNVFFTYSNKLFSWHKGDTVVKNIYTDNQNKVFMRLYADEQNTVWIGSRKGLIKTSEKEKPIMQSFLSSASTRQIISDSAFLYVASYSGVFRYAKNRSRSEKDSLISDQASRALFEDTASGYIYIGGEVNYPYNLLRYNKHSGAVEKVTYKGEHITEFVLSIVKDKYNTLWLGTTLGLYSISNGEVKYHKEIEHESVKFLHLYKQGDLLITSGMNKLNFVDVRSGKMKKVPLPDSEGDNEVSYVGEGMDGNIWVGTNGVGLYVLSPDLRVINHLGSTDGLPNDCINAVIWENAHKIWISTNQGLCLYNPGTGKFVSYHLEDGIADEEFNQYSFLKDRDGRFYFGGINGVTTFYPHQLFSDAHSFNVFASNIEKWGTSKKYTLNRLQEELVLDPGEHYLTFTFGVNDYSTPEKTRFYYRIRGIHNEWTLMRERNTLVINKLASGKYTLEVKAMNNHGMVSSNTLTYTIIAKQVFYETWWFMMLVVLLICGGMYLYFTLRLRMIKRLQDVRTQIASHLHDEVGGILTSIAMMSEQLSTTKKPVDETKLKKIAGLSREATLSMSDVLWSIDGRNDSTRNLADRMKELAEDMLLPKGIQPIFDFPSQQNVYTLRPEDRQNFFLIFKEALNNIIKHSAASYVKIHYTYQKDRFLLKIENDGVEEFKRERSGQGLRNIEMRARMLGGTATIEHTGNIVRITVNK